MIKASVEYGLHGAFKVDTYDSNNKLVETTDWFSNFITQTGLMYPNIYSFANCFRFLTIGRDGATNNRGAQAGDANATTGCASPISVYHDDLNNVQDGRWIGHLGYETGADPLLNSSCFTTLTDSGPVFYRAWGIPTGGRTVKDDGLGNNYLSIGELMVSPSSGSDPTGRYAFSRITRPLVLKEGYRAIVSYQLKINIKNGALTPFVSGTFDTGNANVDTDGDMIRQWRYLSGYYRQVWCGLSCVDRWGVSFIPKYGNGMEPSLSNLNNYYIYFSPDNAEFDVNPLSGGAQNDTTKAWASDGIMTPLGFSTRDALTLTPSRDDLGSDEAQYLLFYGPEQTLTTIPVASTPYNIRLGNDSLALKTPNLRNYSVAISDEYNDSSFNYQVSDRYVNASVETISYANPGSGGIKLDRGTQFHERAVFSSRLFRLPIDFTNYTGNAYAGRRKNVTRKAVFSPANALGYNTRYGSMVYAYKMPNNAQINDYTFYPTIDCLFYDTSGRSMLQHYRQVSGIYLTSRGSGLVGGQVNITYAGGAAAGQNIVRHVSLKTFHGPMSGQFEITGAFIDIISETGALLSGNLWGGVTGSSNQNPTYINSGNTNFGNTTNGYSGWGSVYGTYNTGYLSANRPYDVGIANHHTGITTNNPTGTLYWPSVYGTPLAVTFSNLVFSGNNATVFYTDNQGASDAALASSGWQRPTGVILHYDALGVTGYRLLPNYGTGNINDVNTYAPSPNVGYGGTYPGFSTDNGVELYLDIIWSSDCGSAADCFEPPAI